MLPISAIITDHDPKRKQLLIEATESILRGEEIPSEILIILDMNLEIAEEYISELKQELPHKFINIYVNHNTRGPAGARNFGLKISNYDWIAFLDSDDLWHPKKLSLQWKFLQKRPFLKACHTKELWIKNGNIITTPKSLEPGTGKFLMQAFQKCFISMSSILIQKKIIFSLNGFDESLNAAEDYDFWLRYLIFYPIALVPDFKGEPLTIKRSGNWTQTSQTKNIDVYRLYSLIKIYHHFFEYLNHYEKQCLLSEIKYKWNIVTKHKQKYTFEPQLIQIYNKILTSLNSFPL